MLSVINEAVYGIHGMILKEKKPEYSKKNVSNATVAATKSTAIGVGLSPVLPGDRPATDCLRHCKAPYKIS